MSVLACSRTNCNGIMCDVLIHGIGYICYECKNEFEKSVKGLELTEQEWMEKLKTFIETRKSDFSGHDADKKMDSSDFFHMHERE